MKNNFFFAFLTVGSCLRLLGEHVQKVSQNLTTWIRKEKFFSLYSVGKEVAHSSQKKKLLVISFEWKVRFG
jgi:hypothetical protein